MQLEEKLDQRLNFEEIIKLTANQKDPNVVYVDGQPLYWFHCEQDWMIWWKYRTSGQQE